MDFGNGPNTGNMLCSVNLPTGFSNATHFRSSETVGVLRMKRFPKIGCIRHYAHLFFFFNIWLFISLNNGYNQLFPRELFVRT